VANHWSAIEVIVNLIANTTTAKGLQVKSELDTGTYPAGIKVSDEELAQVVLRPAKFHGEWNYSILPDPSHK
jgi:Rhodopirellula transposase DDE domain